MIQEYTANEICIATITSHLETGENFDGAISIGYYANLPEVWIQYADRRLNVQPQDLDALCKQLKRAKLIVLEQKK